MSKIWTRKFIVPLTLAIFILWPELALAQGAAETAIGIAGSLLGGTFDLVGMVLAPLGYMIMKLISLVTSLSGIALNATIFYTVIQMAQTFSDVPAIDEAWGVIRDIANMGFIFVLLWASIELIIGRGSNTQRLIVNIIIAAILINFSLFFTKFVIDIANLLALTFYNTIAPGASLSADNFLNAGLSNSMMEVLRMPSLIEAETLLDGGNVFTITMLSSAVLLITAFVFFAVSVMFVVRYVVLIFVLILSPIAFVSSVLPGLSGYAKQWREALFNQAFFAPIFFLLMWITILVARGINGAMFNGAGGWGAALGGLDGSDYSPGFIQIVINFAVIIGFLIFSLITAKSAADKSGKMVSNLTKTALGAAGGLSFGMAGRLGRTTLGRVGQAVADSEALKKAAPTSRLARLTLAAGQKSAKSTFDARGAAGFEKISDASGVSFGKASGKGGYFQAKKDKAEEEKKIADSFKPSDLVISRAEKELEEAKKTTDKARIANAQKAVDDLKGVSEDEAKKRKIREIREASGWTMGEKEARKRMGEREGTRYAKIKEMMDADSTLSQKAAEDKWKENFDAEMKKRTDGGMDEKKARAEVEEAMGLKFDTVKGAATERKEAYAKDVENAMTEIPFIRKEVPIHPNRFAFVGMVSKEAKEAALAIRKSVKDKKPADKMAEEAAKVARETAEDSDTGSASTGGSGSTGSSSGGSGSGTSGPAAPAATP